jgi:hypothetical protein
VRFLRRGQKGDNREPPLGGVAIQGYAKNAASAVTISRSTLNTHPRKEEV